jgi:hypothetical protein
MFCSFNFNSSELNSTLFPTLGNAKKVSYGKVVFFKKNKILIEPQESFLNSVMNFWVRLLLELLAARSKIQCQRHTQGMSVKDLEDSDLG